jgi:hypothetical protein
MPVFGYIISAVIAGITGSVMYVVHKARKRDKKFIDAVAKSAKSK